MIYPSLVNKLRLASLMAAICLCLASSVNALALSEPPAPQLNVKSYVLMDAKSGITLAQKNQNQKLPPASLTKLMTLYLVSQELAKGRIHLSDKVRISKEAWSQGGSRMFIKEGSSVTIADLVKGIIVASGNDACVAIAQHISGNEQSFAQLMNQTAKQLGMSDSHFINSTGLPHPDHKTTAHDLAILTRALITKFPQYYGWYQQKWITYNKIRQPNRNRLLWRDHSVDGLKTGHTEAAGYCLVASAKRHQMRLISIIVGAPSDAARTSDSQGLLNWGFRYYQSQKLFDAHTPIIKPQVWLGHLNKTELGLTKDFYITVPTGEQNAIQTTVKVPTYLRAPIIKGQIYGQIIIKLHQKTIAEAPLVALKADPLGNWFSRMIDHIALFFKKLF